MSWRSFVPERLRPIGYLTHLTQSRCRSSVASGPFTGMKYINKSAGSAYIPKLLGIYERELHDIIEYVCRLNIRTVINVGAGEGYYAVGLAVRMPFSSVIAFERDPQACAEVRALARLN